MISLNQILLLEQKVESAVEKIKRLQAENDALRKSCEELTNALSVKSEQLSQFEQEQSQIESGIKNALERLTAIENSVLEATSQKPQDIQKTVEQTIEQSFETTTVSPAPQNTISQNNTFSAPQENASPYMQESVPQTPQIPPQQPTEQPYVQESVPQNSQGIEQENAPTYTQENSSPEPQNFAQQNNVEQQEPFLQQTASYGEETVEEENTVYDQEIENSFDDGLLFSQGPEDTEIDDFYEEQESPESNSSNNEQDTPNIDIY